LKENCFEQLCINYVNEKLQQIFIELTLKTEQEEYVRERIKWTEIKYFNNKIVCDLIEERRPPGIFAALNDATATAHADPMAADNSFIQRTAALATNPHFEARGSQFLVRHYAGDVMYQVAGMTDKNKDALVKDLLDLVSLSGNAFLQTLFPERPDPNSKKRPPTAGDRIKVSEISSAHDIGPTNVQFRYLQGRWSTISCVHNRHTSVRSNRTRIGAQQNMTRKRSSTRLSTLAYKRIFESVVRASHIEIRLKKWSSGSIFYLPIPHTRENTHGRVTLAPDAREYSLTPGSRRRSGRWVSQRPL
jgi:Myosin head (motor domain)